MPPRKKAATTKGKKTAQKATNKVEPTASKTAEASSKKQTTKRARSPESSSNVESPSEVQQDSKRPQKRAKKAIEETTLEPQSTVEPNPSGKFDLYAMELPFLAKAYLPPGQAEPQFGALYDTILTYQAKPDFTARCAIPEAPFGKDTDGAGEENEKRGRLESAVLEDPMEGMPWDIALVDLSLADPLVFPPAERKQFASLPQTNCGAGIQGRTVLAAEHCGVQRADGVFRMQRVWTGERDGKAVELWEGYLSFDVVHGGMYRRKGHGSGEKIGFPFWAVRARKGEDGNEIGLHAE
ncbi:hypothetical protein MVEN_00639900 [Mycena venus]|uniref:Uncharacterized protein n=1 Tax=Mycena venus TaxID=2733690 RepID=A0A8H6YKP2_9AGAR|nr:hypothetical protein MVEN_00639900 [Mycena venus]